MRRSRTGQLLTLRNIIWLGIISLLTVYGILAFNSGLTLSPTTNSNPSAEYEVSQITQDTKSIGQADSQSVERVLPEWIEWVASAKDESYAYSEDSLLQTQAHFFSMSDTKRQVLSFHMILGLILMTAGILQFWPRFRRRHRKWHRASGSIYIVAAFFSMSSSAYHLATSQIDDVYSQYVFYMGLWFLILLSLSSIVLAMFEIKRKHIALHLGWQALAFGCFLTAPIQRFLWISLAPLAGERSFNEMNIVVNISLIALALFCGYLLFIYNRAVSPIKRSAITADPALALHPATLPITFGATVISWAFMLVYYGISAGFHQSSAAQHLVPSLAQTQHDHIVTPVFGAGLLLLTSLALIFYFWSLSQLRQARFSKRTFAGLTISTLMTIGCLLYLGSNLGWPTHEAPVGGVFYVLTASFLLFFLFRYLLQWRNKAYGKLQETLVFLGLFTVAPGLMQLLLSTISVSNLIPATYAAQGHGYQIAAAAALVIPMLIGHLSSMFSGETQRHSVQ
ncbi:MAG: DUF2306 domain-containing protein [Pseudomonadota bacterium]|nr:DUF2306 domain-containing protein [Pseudomonadota bacterium]